MTLATLRTAAATSLAAAGLLFALSACSTPTSTQPAITTAPAAATETASVDPSAPCAGVKVIVDSGSLKQSAANSSVCVPADAATPASKVLETAKIKTEGTVQYPTELVCRVNGVPAVDLEITHKAGTYKEECQGMPAAFAYWSIWVKPSGGAWEYAQEGLATLQVKPGESLELLYVVDNEPAAPAA